MSSLNKIEANRANAQHSTGPVTAEGKAKSAQNARKHGLSSATIFIPPDRQDEFEQMYAAYHAELLPIGEIQTTYFEQLVHAAWNLNIARQLLVRALHELDDKKLATANRYVAQYERSFARAHQALKDEQTDFALRAIPENAPVAALPLACRIRTVAAEATRLATRSERTQRARAVILQSIGDLFTPTPEPAAA